MNFKKNYLASILLVLVFGLIVFSPVISLAQSTGSGPNTPTAAVTIDNPIKANNVQDFVKTILEGIIKIGIPLVAIAIIYSGFLFVTAIGKPDKIKEAKDALLYTVIGAAILLGSWAIAQLISETVLSL
ncbi:MAG: hypothetical protein WC011_01405 [Candidatus Paceibacterota bacterium]